MISNFPEIVKKHLGHLATDDYPVLNSFLVVSIWLSFVLDQSQTSMRSVCKRLNVRGIKVKVSTFSKASKNRDPRILYDRFLALKQELHKKHKTEAAKLTFGDDSTRIWQQSIR